MKLLIICSSALWTLISVGCQNNERSFANKFCDTILTSHTVELKYHHDTERLKAPAILESTTVTITDSMTRLLEFRILRSDKTYDSLNFMNCIYEERYFPVQHYSVSNNILICDLYLPTQLSRFYLGTIVNSDEGVLTVAKGHHLILAAYGPAPGYSRIRLKIYLPLSYRLNKIRYFCQ